MLGLRRGGGATAGEEGAGRTWLEVVGVLAAVCFAAAFAWVVESLCKGQFGCCRYGDTKAVTDRALFAELRPFATACNALVWHISSAGKANAPP